MSFSLLSSLPAQTPSIQPTAQSSAHSPTEGAAIKTLRSTRLRNRLKTKINLALIFVLTAVLTVYSLWDIVRVRADEHARLDRDIAAALDLLGAGLPKPLWDLNTAIVQDMLRGLMSQPAVAGISVLDTNGRPTTTMIRDGEIKEVAQLPAVPKTYPVSRELTFHDGDTSQPLGSVTVLVSEEPLTRTVMQAVTRNVLIVILLNVILAIAMGLALNSLVLDPLAAILGRVQDIAEGEGDLTKRVETGRQDEFGQLGEALNRFIGSVHRIVTEVDEVVAGLAHSADDARQTADGLNRQLSRQQEDLYSLTTALTQFRATTEEVARNAALAAESGAQAGDRANLGLEQVRKANRSNGELAETVDRAAIVITELR